MLLMVLLSSTDSPIRILADFVGIVLVVRIGKSKKNKTEIRRNSMAEIAHMAQFFYHGQKLWSKLA
jgi:hypothetical protein